MLSQGWKVCVLIVCISSLVWSSGAMLPLTTTATAAKRPTQHPRNLFFKLWYNRGLRPTDVYGRRTRCPVCCC
ncbi:MAG: hypothetical protein GFH27_549325n4 [Chloroflexi bacterium AL-W]|nr:hypothetical protein [Chloroflexi bacterium AL-N1]NOK70148.1 hypothetical protein [Chloroflexi bacterium AL-N10]NOK77842.1 hypothetical protein [Chloroflexi bacterium AL-N5]NOK84851.1 hypothetical protein [Chloroflexi bacterium AL-W]